MWDTLAIIVLLLLAGSFLLYRYVVKRTCGCSGCGTCADSRDCSGTATGHE